MVSIRYNLVIKVFLIVNVSTLCGLSCGTLPAEVEKCLPADTNCIVRTMNDVLRRYPQGNPSFGLNPLTRMEITDVVISKAPANNPIQLNLQFNRFIGMGLESAIIERVVGFEKDPKTSKFEIYGLLPNFHISGDYEMKGKVLLLPIDGKGKANIDLENLKFGCKVKVSAEERNGKTYVKVDNLKSQLLPENVKVNFENLFHSNKELSDTLNTMINENWTDVWSELEDGINNAMSEIIKKLVSTVLLELSYDDFYRTE